MGIASYHYAMHSQACGTQLGGDRQLTVVAVTLNYTDHTNRHTNRRKK